MIDLVLTILVSLQATPAPVPPPPDRLVVDCAAPVYAIDRLICADRDLAAQEAEIASLLSMTTPGAGLWIEDQSTWLRRRALCAFHSDQSACIQAANAERLAVLSPPSDTSRQAVTCRDGRMERRWSLAITGDIVTAYDETQQKALVATPISPDWTPFVRRPTKALTFGRADGATIRCAVR